MPKPLKAIKCDLCNKLIEPNQEYVDSDKYIGVFHTYCFKAIEAFDREHDKEEFDTLDLDVWLEEKVCTNCWKYEDGLCHEPNTAACIKTYEMFGKDEYMKPLGIIEKKEG